MGGSAFTSFGYLWRRQSVDMLCSTGGRNNTDRHLWRWKSKERVLDIEDEVYICNRDDSGNRSGMDGIVYIIYGGGY